MYKRKFCFSNLKCQIDTKKKTRTIENVSENVFDSFVKILTIKKITIESCHLLESYGKNHQKAMIHNLKKIQLILCKSVENVAKLME